MLKRRLQYLVVWSSRPPLTLVYRMIYRVLIRFAVFILKRYRGIISIYLCRGCAKNDITPGISDIDLLLVTTNNERARQSIQKAYHTLGMATGRLIDYYPKLVTAHIAGIQSHAGNTATMRAKPRGNCFMERMY